MGKGFVENHRIDRGGDLVVIHVIMTFTPRGGKAFDFPVTEVWRFRAGLAIELRPFYWDTKLIADTLAAASVK